MQVLGDVRDTKVLQAGNGRGLSGRIAETDGGRAAMVGRSHVLPGATCDKTGGGARV